MNQIKVNLKNALFGQMTNFKVQRDVDDGFISKEEAKQNIAEKLP